MHRLVERDGDQFQSTGKFSIRKELPAWTKRALYISDAFHSFVDLPTHRIIVVVSALYVFLVVFFASLYYFIGTRWGCGLNIATFVDAMGFSVETMAAIGYGTEDIFFWECVLPISCLAFQVCVKLGVDSLAIGILYCRLSGPGGRARSIKFSNNAVIRRVHGKLFLMVQVCELRQHQLSEVKVRMYAIRRDVDPGSLHTDPPSLVVTHFQTVTMRLTSPSSGQLMLWTPQVIIHELNCFSPLMPPPLWVSTRGEEVRWTPPAFGRCYDEPPHISDILEHTPTTSRLSDFLVPGHVAYEDCSPPQIHPLENRSLVEMFNVELEGHRAEREMVKRFMTDRRLEVIVVVEGVDETSGAAIQCIHSYISSEIEWHKMFKPSVSRDDADRAVMVDFDLFHQLKPAPFDAPSAESLSSLA